MKLIIAEKNDAARQIAERLTTGKPKKDKVYNTAIYRFEWKGEECVTIGLAGHILAPDFCDSVLFDKKLGWYSVTETARCCRPTYPMAWPVRPTTPSASRSLPTVSPLRAGSSRACPTSRGTGH